MSDVQDILDAFLVLQTRTQNVFPKFTDLISRVYFVLNKISEQQENEDTAKFMKKDADDLFQYLMDLAEIGDSNRKLFIDLVESQKEELEQIVETTKKITGE